MDSTYQTCNVDCIAKATYTVKQCYDKCEACVTGPSCWTTVEYGTDTDCFDDCYESCDDYWPTSSSLCRCDGHSACVFGCPGNCTPSSNFLVCNVDCLGNGGDEYDCLDFCTGCAVDKGCWVTTEYGGESDVTCFEDCYTSCADTLGASSTLCVCASHA
jgi:hypothetical protein